jgi:hypothetical protein
MFLSDHVPEIDANTEPDPALLGQLGLTVDHSALDLDRTPDGIDHAWELGKEAVAGVLHDPAPVLADLGVDQFPEVGLEPLVRPLFVGSHQPRVPRHVGGENCGETTGLAHVASPAARRRPESKRSLCSGFRSVTLGEITAGVMALSRLTISRASSSRPIWA